MFVRPSKFRHVFGCPFKKESCYEGLKATKSAHDTNFCAVNPLFVAVVVESSGGGSFVVLPIEKTGKVDVNVPKVCGHRAPITDLKWCPHSDFMIASCSDDATIKIWSIPDEGLFHNITEPLMDLSSGHHKRVSYIEWHPCAQGVLLSAGADHKCIIWDTESGRILSEVTTHLDAVFSISWNFDGSLFATTCKDKIIRVIDPRTGEVVAEGMGHQGNKASKAVFLNGTQIFTTGFSRSSERQFALWDYNNLSAPIKMEEIDSSCGTVVPFFDPDLNIVYLAGKGDGNIRYVEIVDQPPFVYFLNQFQSSIPQRGLGMMPKRGLDRKKCEIARFYKLHSTKDICEPISMIVPRKSDNFQPDIYPPTASTQPSVTCQEWTAGVNKPPLLMGVESGSLFQGGYPRRATQPINGSYQPEESQRTSLSRSTRSRSLHRENPSGLSRSSTFTPSIAPQEDCYNSVTDLAGSNPSKRPVVERRRRRRSRSDRNPSESGNRSSLSSHEDDSRSPEIVQRPKATWDREGDDLPMPKVVPMNGLLSAPASKFYSSPHPPGDSSQSREHIGAVRTSSNGSENPPPDGADVGEHFQVQNVVLLDSSGSPSELDDLEKSGSRAMLDCISVDAPDDMVILPSTLRASMTSRQRKFVRGGLSSSSFAKKVEKPPNSELQGLIRVGSVREKSRNYNSITDRGMYSKKSDSVLLIDSAALHDESKTSTTSPQGSAVVSLSPPEPASRSEHKQVTNFSTQQNRSVLGKMCSLDQAPRNAPPAKAVTARVLPLSSNSSSRKLPGKSLSDFRNSGSMEMKNVDESAVERRTNRIERRHIDRSTIEVVPRHSNVNNNIINNSNINFMSSLNDSKKTQTKQDSSLSHSELLQEYQRQQKEIKRLKSLLEQKDAKMKKMEEELQMYKYRNRRLI